MNGEFRLRMRTRIRILFANLSYIMTYSSYKLRSSANFARISFAFRVSMLFLSYVFCSDLTFAFSVTMSSQQSIPMSQIGSLSLPDPADRTLGHY